VQAAAKISHCFCYSYFPSGASTLPFRPCHLGEALFLFLHDNFWSRTTMVVDQSLVAGDHFVMPPVMVWL